MRRGRRGDRRSCMACSPIPYGERDREERSLRDEERGREKVSAGVGLKCSKNMKSEERESLLYSAPPKNLSGSLI